MPCLRKVWPDDLDVYDSSAEIFQCGPNWLTASVAKNLAARFFFSFTPEKPQLLLLEKFSLRLCEKDFSWRRFLVKRAHANLFMAFQTQSHSLCYKLENKFVLNMPLNSCWWPQFIDRINQTETDGCVFTHSLLLVLFRCPLLTCQHFYQWNHN